MEGSILLAFLLTLGAGLSTGIGSAIAFFARRTNTRFLSGALGFSAGVMIYVSFVEILPEGTAHLAEAHGDRAGSLWATVGFFAGMAIIAAIDRLVPSFENPHEARPVEAMRSRTAAADTLSTAAPPDPRPATQPASGRAETERRFMRLGVLAALAIAIHNFPEGIATFVTAMGDPTLGVSIAVAIAIHNIPEGIAISVPVYYATGNRSRAFWLSFASGLSEPLGAALGYLLLLQFLGDALLGWILSGVAGIMVFISLDELFPAAREYGEGHVAVYGLMAGMAVMAASLLLLA